MNRDFQQVAWDEFTIDDCRALIRLAVREDLDRGHDWTTIALVPAAAQGAAHVVARQDGVIAGLHAARLVIEEMNLKLTWEPRAADGASVQRGEIVARIAGSARDLLTGERPLLNFMGRLSGIATLTRRFVEAIAGTGAKLYDTRKTSPGWRRLEKYAVRCGGGTNHRTGLFDAVLIKDNHLAFRRQEHPEENITPATSIDRVREFLAELVPPESNRKPDMLEIELDSLADFAAVLEKQPEIVLLDNMPPAELRRAVELRNRLAPEVQLEASGGVRLETIRAIAESGVDRISCGALTHSAVNFDVALDWEEQLRS